MLNCSVGDEHCATDVVKYAPTLATSRVADDGAIGNLGQAIIVVDNPDRSAITAGIVMTEQTIGDDILYRVITNKCSAIGGPIIAEFTPI